MSQASVNIETDYQSIRSLEATFRFQTVSLTSDFLILNILTKSLLREKLTNCFNFFQNLICMNELFLHMCIKHIKTNY